jgi:hypothetical protein
MDRRHNSETAGHLTGKQFRSALDLIIASYGGASADRIYRDAIVCFDSLIEISRNTDAILDFARRHDIDNKYLVDGASFVISRMHFNPENNYYITMGLARNVSPEEIRDRWKKLMLLYHPDRQGGDESWLSERAKKVNEAYSVLKDAEKRQAFDRKLLEQEISKKPAAGAAVVPMPVRSGSGSKKISQDPEWDRKKKKIPMFLVGAYLIVALGILGYIYYQNNTERLDSALSGKDGPLAKADLAAGHVSEKENLKNTGPADLQGQPETMEGSGVKQPLYAAPEPEGKQKAGAPAVMQKPAPVVVPAAQTADRVQREAAVRKESARDIVSPGGGPALKKSEPLLPRPPSGPVKSPPTDVQETVQKSSPPPAKEAPAAAYTTARSEPPRPARQEVASRQQEQYVKQADITREEVEEFMQRYSSTFVRGDLKAFMALFSRSVVENNKLHYNEVRDAYRETFAAKINSYHVNNMMITVTGQNAVVSGTYDLNRYAPAEDRWVRYSGKIQWKIAKENNELKIIASTYDK